MFLPPPSRCASQMYDCQSSHVWDASHHPRVSCCRAPQSSWKRRNGVVSNLCRVSLKPRQSNAPEAVTGDTPVHQAQPLFAGTGPAVGHRQLRVPLMLRQSCKCVRYAASVGGVSATINRSNAVTRTLGEERRETSSPSYLKQRETTVVRVTRMTPSHTLQRLPDSNVQEYSIRAHGFLAKATPR